MALDSPTEATALPAVSVVMPMYRESTVVLKRTIDSILNQTFHDLELVVVVDNPYHVEGIRLLDDYSKQDPRVRYCINERNRGVWPSYNRGLQLARGRYIAIQDADDASHPRRIEILHSFLQAHPDVDVAGGSLEYVDEATNAVLMTRRYPQRVGRAIRFYCPVAHGTILRKRELHDRFGAYDESPDVKHAADYELWCRWHSQGARIANIGDVVYTYYQHPLSFKSQNVKRILRDTVRIKRRYAKALKFGAAAYAYLMIETIVSFLPSSTIMLLFFCYNKMRSRVSNGRQ